MSILTTQKDLYSFLSQFAQTHLEFDHQSIDQRPSNLQYPFITFSAPIENWEATGIAQVRIFDKTNDYESVFNVAYQIEEMIKQGYNYNSLVIHQGSPFVQVVPTDEDNIKCLYINLEIQFN